MTRVVPCFRAGVDRCRWQEPIVKGGKNRNFERSRVATSPISNNRDLPCLFVTHEITSSVSGPLYVVLELFHQTLAPRRPVTPSYCLYGLRTRIFLTLKTTMPRDLQISNQSASNNQENENPQLDSTNNPLTHSPTRDDEEFVDIDHDDVEMHDPETVKQSVDDLDLHTFGTNLHDPDEEDDSEEDQDHMANHPLLSMLTGRMGQRRRGSTHQWDSLHPVTQVLSVANVADCDELEISAFPEHERCSREKVCRPTFAPEFPPPMRRSTRTEACGHL
jgi:hypothetical protein